MFGLNEREANRATSWKQHHVDPSKAPSDANVADRGSAGKTKPIRVGDNGIFDLGFPRYALKRHMSNEKEISNGRVSWQTR